MKHSRGIQKIIRLFAYQLAVTTIFSSLMLFWGIKAALSVCLGGFVCILPNVYFAKKLFQHEGARSAKKIVSNFYQGEAIKLFLSALLFALVFIVFKPQPLLFFIAYMAIQLVFWFAPLII